MGNLIFTFEAPDFEHWLAVYQSREDLRRTEGIHEVGLYRSVRDERGVVLHLQVDNMDRALAFFSAPAFRTAQAQAGVAHVTVYTATPAY